MSKPKKNRNVRTHAAYRPLAIAALIASGVLQPLLPVLAAGTAANTAISNTATATYKDDSGTSFDATSNTVKITVAPVSGITVKSTGITDINAGSVEKGDQLQYNFDVKNVGNIASGIYIPSSPTATNFTVTGVEVDINDGNGFKALSTFTGNIVPAVAADATIKVRVTGNVPSTGIAAGDKITVTLGNAGLNDNGLTTQNVTETDNATTNTSDVRTTFTPLGGTNPTDNKEGSATQAVAFATQVKPQAFSLLKKTVLGVTPGNTAAGNDDTINYNLNFSVLNSSPNGSLSPADLVGTQVKVDNVSGSQILVSDAVPAGTTLAAAPTAPGGWQTVYSYDNIDTTIPIVSGDPTALPAAAWTKVSTTAPVLANVKRIGFIKTVPSMATTAAAVDFPISVITSGLPVNGGKVENIAQVFGQTSGDATGKVVVDESGDANPSNFENGNPGPDFDPAKDTGKADPTTQGIDTKGDNSGVGPKGEDTEVTITGTIAPASDSLFNGPNAKADAVGPTDSNDDFTNASTPVPAGQDPAVAIAATQATSFKNTISNPSTVTLAEITAEPVAPSKAETADGNATHPNRQYGLDGDIPVDTLVKITDLTIGSTKTATYKYAVTGGVGTFVLQNAYNATTNPTGSKPVNFGGLAPNATVNYQVDVTLPINSVKPLAAVSIPVIAFSDESPTATPGYTNELTNNITIDRAYVGYMKLIKEARLLSADKNTIIQDWTDAALASVPGTLSSKAATGQFIEYRIRYQNISTPANGSGNVILNAKNFKLIEDGAAAVGSNTNNWGTFTTHQQNTTASQGTVNYYTGALLIGTTDPADGNDVTKYENVVSTLAPNAQGVFQFRRVVK